MIGFLIRRWKFGHRDRHTHSREMPDEDEGRNWSDAVTSQGIPRIRANASSRNRQGWTPLDLPSRGTVAPLTP